MGSQTATMGKTMRVGKGPSSCERPKHCAHQEIYVMISIQIEAHLADQRGEDVCSNQDFRKKMEK